MDERELRAILRFGVDQASLNKAAQASDRLGQQVEQDADGVAKRMIAIATEMKRVQDQADIVSRKMGLLRDAADIGGEIAEGFAAAGAALSGTLLLSINAYLKSAGTAESTARRWQSTTDNLARSQQRVGRVAAQSILPVLEDAARLADRAARFAEKNPEIIGAALKIGAVTATLGAVGVAVSRGIRLIADTKQLVYETMALKAAQIQAAAADKQLAAAGINAKSTTGGLAGAAGSALLRPLIPGAAAAAGGTLAARTAMATGAKAATIAGVPLTAAGGVTGAGLLAAVSPLTLAGGLGLGGLGYNAIQRSQWGQERGLASLGQYASVAAYGAGSLFGQGSEWFQAVAEFTGELDKTNEAAQNATTALNRVGGGGALADTQAGQAARAVQTAEGATTAAEAVETQREIASQMQSVWEQYYEQLAEADKSWARQAEDTAIAAAREQAEIARQAAQQRQAISQQYSSAIMQAEQSYNRARAQAARDHAQQMADIEEEYQRTVRDIEDEYQTTLEDAIIDRDATAVYRAQRQRAEQLEDARENRDEQREDANEDYAEQLNSAREALEEQRAAAREAREQALQELQEQLVQQAEAQRIADQQRIADENLARQRETEDQRSWLNTQLSQVRSKYSSEYSATTSHYNRLLSAAQNYYSRMSSMSSSGSPLGRHEYNGVGGYAAGGYTGAGGMALLHANEFVLTAGTTERLEQSLGALTQERVGMLASGGSGVSISMQNTFSGVSAGDERALAQWATQVKNETLRAVSAALTR